MSDNAPHREFKDKLLKFLRSDIAGQAAWKKADIAFACNDHTHLWGVPPWAAWVESERFRKTPSGLSFRLDIVILDADDNHLAIVEVSARNRVNHCRQAVSELEIPWFRFWAPPPDATQAVLAARTYPEGHWFRNHDGFHSEVDGYVQYGATRLGMIYHSEVAPRSVNIGNILFASATNLTCQWADWYDKGGRLWKSVKIHRERRSRSAHEIGGKILDTMDTFNRNPQTFTAGIGEWQLHGEIGIFHLNRNPDTGKYHPVDIGILMEQQRLEHIAMLQAMYALKAHNEIGRPSVWGSEPLQERCHPTQRKIKRLAPYGSWLSTLWEIPWLHLTLQIS